MGTVYEAEQHHPRRRVAIKAIRPGRITPQMSKRFEYEAQVLARLEHPGIARLYESNTQSEGGHVRAYLAMELVEGVADRRVLRPPTTCRSSSGCGCS